MTACRSWWRNCALETDPEMLAIDGMEDQLAPVGEDLLKVRGEVTAVDPQLGKFEIQTADGERLRFFVDENTRYQGKLSSLD